MRFVCVYLAFCVLHITVTRISTQHHQFASLCRTLIPPDLSSDTDHQPLRRSFSPLYRLSVIRGPSVNQITVTLHSAADFVGFLVQVNWVDGESVADEPNYRPIDCDKPTIVHVDKRKKRKITAVFNMENGGNAAVTGTVENEAGEYFELPMVFI